MNGQAEEEVEFLIDETQIRKFCDGAHVEIYRFYFKGVIWEMKVKSSKSRQGKMITIDITYRMWHV